MAAAPTSRPSTPVVVMIVVGLVGVITTWALAPYLLGIFILLMLAAAVTITVIQNKKLKRARCPHCNYDTSGLPRTAMKCPECGRLLTDK